MTLVLSCITEHDLIQVSDRRIVYWQPNGSISVRDDTTNKVVLLNQQLAWSFTGLATIGGQRTDKWLANLLNQRTSDSLPHIAALIASRAEVAFQQIPFAKENKRHAFIAIGWLLSNRIASEGSGFKPFILVISNAINEAGAWLEKARDQFAVFHRTLQRKEDFALEVTGQPPAESDRIRAKRLIRQCIEKDTGPRPIARILAGTIRKTARTNRTVGKSLLVVSIPKSSIQDDAWTFTNELPAKKGATFLSVSQDGYTTQYGPTFVGDGIISDIRIVRGRKARELAQSLPKTEPPDTIVLTEWTGAGTLEDSRRPALGDDYSPKSCCDITSAYAWPKDTYCPYYGLLVRVRVDEDTLGKIERDSRYIVITRSKDDLDGKPSNAWLNKLKTWFETRGMPVKDTKDLVNALTRNAAM